jgi:hypothetical protein
MIGVYVNDCLAIGKRDKIDELIVALKTSGFNLKVVTDTKTFCLKIRPRNKIKNWILHVFCDSDWAGDSEKRISVTGFIVYLMNVQVCWRSKAQRGVTLSSSEVEYVAMSEAVKKIKFIYYLLSICQSR